MCLNLCFFAKREKRLTTNVLETVKMSSLFNASINESYEKRLENKREKTAPKSLWIDFEN